MKGQENGDLILPFSAIDRNALSVSGGKAANLGELVRAGFPVPPGFVITTAAYDFVVRTNNLQHDIDTALQFGTAQVRAGFEQAMIPPDVEQAIGEAYR